MERFAGITVSRPAPAAREKPALPRDAWEAADLRFDRDKGWRGNAPAEWLVEFGPAMLRLALSAGGQLGVFPEHVRVAELLTAWLKRPPLAAGRRAANLFAHTGLLTLWLAASPKMLETVHVDAAAGAVRRARENARLSGLERATVRWLTEGAPQFLAREARRNRQYDLIAMDPPAYGRDGRGGDWKLERDLPGLLELAGRLLAPGGIVSLACHRRNLSASTLSALVEEGIPGLREIKTIPLILGSEAGGAALLAGQALLACRLA